MKLRSLKFEVLVEGKNAIYEHYLLKTSKN